MTMRCAVAFAAMVVTTSCKAEKHPPAVETKPMATPSGPALTEKFIESRRLETRLSGKSEGFELALTVIRLSQ